MSTIAVGDEVALPQGHRAVLRWIGRIPGRTPVEYAGVEVLGPDAERLGKHSGAYQGTQLFAVSRPGTGLFVSYTQLVGANVKSARVETPRTRGSLASTAQSASLGGSSSFAGAAGGPDVASPSPRYHKPPLRLAASVQTLNRSPRRDSTTPSTPSTPPASELREENARLAAELERVRRERAGERKSFEAKRAEFRETLKTVNLRVEQLAGESDARAERLRDEYEAKLKHARRSSSLLAPAGGSEVQEQRLALAAMQNKLVAERTEKQQEIDSLKRELAHVRSVTGGSEDLEALVADLSSMEQQLKDMRSKVDEMDALQRELEDTRRRNAELELAATGPGRRASDQSEISRLEAALELRLLRETELEAQNERLLAQLALRTDQKNEPAAGGAEAERASADDSWALTSDAETPLHARMRPGLREARAAPEPSVAAVAPLTVAPLDNPVDTPHKEPVEKPLKDMLSAPAADASGGALAAEAESSQFVDLAAGRNDWCSICERQGHSAVDCPWE